MFYNVLTEGTMVEMFLLILLEIIILAILLKFSGFKFLRSKLIYISILGFFVSLSSAIFINSSFGGFNFYERSGYPYQFLFRHYSDDLLLTGSMPSNEAKIFDVDLVRFFINYIFWTLLVAVIFAGIKLIKQQINQKHQLKQS